MNKPVLNLSKGATLDLTKHSGTKNFKIGLDWEPGLAGKVDLDLMLVAMKGDQPVNACYFNNLEFEGLKHTGDSRDGAGAIKPDEQVILNFDEMKTADRIIIVAGIFDGASNFSMVRDTTVEVRNGDNDQIIATFKPSIEIDLFPCAIFGEFKKDINGNVNYTTQITTFNSLSDSLKSLGFDC